LLPKDFKIGTDGPHVTQYCVAMSIPPLPAGFTTVALLSRKGFQVFLAVLQYVKKSAVFCDEVWFFHSSILLQRNENQCDQELFNALRLRFDSLPQVSETARTICVRSILAFKDLATAKKGKRLRADARPRCWASSTRSKKFETLVKRAITSGPTTGQHSGRTSTGRLASAAKVQ